MKLIEEILADLYKSDFQLKKYDSELRRTLKIMLKSKPEVEVDEAFKEDLRAQLLQKIEQLKQEKMKHNLSYYISLPKLAYAFSGALLLALVLLPIMLELVKEAKPIKGELKTTPSITVKSDEAFGSLLIGGEAPAELASEQRALGIESEPNVANDKGAEIGRIRPDYYSYRFSYVGEDFLLGEDKVKVFKRINPGSAVLNSLINRMDLGLIDLSTLANLKVSHLNLYQDKEGGYNIYIDLKNGSISVNKMPEYNLLKDSCAGDRCYDFQEPLSLADVPSDEKIIAASNKFLESLGISTSAYGKPLVQKYWEQYPITDSEKQLVSDQVPVIYPLILDGKIVYTENGTVYGLSMSVNIRDLEAVSIYNLSAQSYESSMYPGLTDKEEVIKWAEDGGIQNIYIADENKVKEVGLGTPSVGYMRFINYQNGEFEEFYTPALIFPIQDVPEGVNVWRKNVVVPLAKDLLKSRNYPIPLLEQTIEPQMLK